MRRVTRRFTPFRALDWLDGFPSKAEVGFTGRSGTRTGARAPSRLSVRSPMEPVRQGMTVPVLSIYTMGGSTGVRLEMPPRHKDTVK
jgi:hypothetical protein